MELPFQIPVNHIKFQGFDSDACNACNKQSQCNAVLNILCLFGIVFHCRNLIAKIKSLLCSSSAKLNDLFIDEVLPSFATPRERKIITLIAGSHSGRGVESHRGRCDDFSLPVWQNSEAPRGYSFIHLGSARLGE